MTMAATQHASGAAEWVRRLRFCLATALVWAGLHFVVGGFLWPHGLQRPMVLFAAPYSGLLPGVLTIAVLWVGAAVATILVGRGDLRHVLMALGLALALWAAQGGRLGGTMDAWLILQNPTQGPPTAAPYWRLLTDYVYLALGIAGAYWICRRLGRPSVQATAQTQPGIASTPERPKSTPREGSSNGLWALLIAVFVAGVVIFILTGPRLAETRRGQVYFAVLVGSFAGTAAAHRLTKVGDPQWYWPVPFVIGVIGLLAAGFSPALTLPSEYQHINSIPAWGLARALPIEMIGVGLLGTIWLLPKAEATAEEGSRAEP